MIYKIGGEFLEMPFINLLLSFQYPKKLFLRVIQT